MCPAPPICWVALCPVKDVISRKSNPIRKQPINANESGSVAIALLLL
jgi:hypothetical protein